MSVLVADCPRCGAERMTFDILGHALFIGMRNNWQHTYELFCGCRHCNKSAVFIVRQEKLEHENFFKMAGALVEYKGALNDYVTIDGFVSLRDQAKYSAPDYVPAPIENAFNEAATCLAVECWNAAAAMFRLCADLATRPVLPKEEVEGLNARTRRDLGLRLRWLFDNGRLPEGLRELSTCIREDGNDGVHAGTLTKGDADDLLDFTTELLERLYTEPAKLKLAEKRRTARREAAKKEPEGSA